MDPTDIDDMDQHNGAIEIVVDTKIVLRDKRGKKVTLEGNREGIKITQMSLRQTPIDPGALQAAIRRIVNPENLTPPSLGSVLVTALKDLPPGTPPQHARALLNYLETEGWRIVRAEDVL